MKKLVTIFLVAFVFATVNGQNERHFSAAATTTIFYEGFESATNDGLPDGWVATSSANGGYWSTEDNLHVYPEEGDLCAVVSYGSSGSVNDAWMFSPGITLSAGHTYTISFLLQMQSSNYSDDYENFEVKIGNAQNAAGMTHYLLECLEEDYEIYYYWVETTCTFTPSTTDVYYLGFHDYTPYAKAGYAAVDEIFVTGEVITHDVAVLSIEQPVSGNDLTDQETVQVTVKNLGETAITAIPICLEIDGDVVATETISTSIDPSAEATYTFTFKADLSAVQAYDIKVYTTLATDINPENDTATKSVEHYEVTDAGVTSISSPIIGGSATATVTATLKNFGNTTITSMPVAYTINNGTPVEETYTGDIESGASADYTFTTTVDLSTTGNYTLKVYTILTGDENHANDTASVLIEYSTAIADFAGENIKMYPNPALDNFTIENAVGAQARIYDISGRLALSTRIEHNVQTININSLTSGIYFVELQDQQNKMMRKLIKQ